MSELKVISAFDYRPKQVAKQLAFMLSSKGRFGIKTDCPSKSLRAELTTAVCWEGVRYAFAVGIIKSEWIEALPKNRNTLNRNERRLILILRHADFQKGWDELPTKARTTLIKSFNDGGGFAARLTKTEEWPLLAKKFANKTQTDDAKIEHNGSTFVIIEILPDASLSMALKDLASDLDSLGVPRKSLKNGNDLKMMLTTLTGLMSLWLRLAKMSKANRNDVLFKRLRQKHDTSSLVKVEWLAEHLVASVAWDIWRMVKTKQFPPPQEFN